MDDRRTDPDRRRGRPRLTDANRKKQILAVKSTTEEVDLFYRICLSQNMTASELLRSFVRSVILASSGTLR